MRGGEAQLPVPACLRAAHPGAHSDTPVTRGRGRGHRKGAAAGSGGARGGIRSLQPRLPHCPLTTPSLPRPRPAPPPRLRAASSSPHRVRPVGVPAPSPRGSADRDGWRGRPGCSGRAPPPPPPHRVCRCAVPGRAGRGRAAPSAPARSPPPPAPRPARLPAGPADALPPDVRPDGGPARAQRLLPALPGLPRAGPASRSRCPPFPAAAGPRGRPGVEPWAEGRWRPGASRGVGGDRRDRAAQKDRRWGNGPTAPPGAQQRARTCRSNDGARAAGAARGPDPQLLPAGSARDAVGRAALLPRIRLSGTGKNPSRG